MSVGKLLVHSSTLQKQEVPKLMKKGETMSVVKSLAAIQPSNFSLSILFCKQTSTTT
jgi:hypothetical protein